MENPYLQAPCTSSNVEPCPANSSILRQHLHPSHAWDLLEGSSWRWGSSNGSAPLRRGAGLPQLCLHQHLRRLQLKPLPIFCCSSRQVAVALRALVLRVCVLSARLVHLWHCSTSAARHKCGLLSISRVLEPGFRWHIGLTVTRSIQVVQFLPTSS